MVSGSGIAEANHKQRVENYFTRFSSYWNRVYEDISYSTPFISYWLHNRKEIVLSLLKAYSNEQSIHVLDVGCGAGVYMRELSKLDHVAFGVDLSLEMFKEARNPSINESRSTAYYAVSDAEKLPFKNESFGAVLCVGVLQYLEKDINALSEICRVVKRGGLVIVTIPNIVRLHMFFDPYYYAEVFYRIINKLAKLDKFHHNGDLFSGPHRANRSYWNRRYYYGGLDNLFSKAGLFKLKTEAVSFSPLSIWQFPLLTHSLSIGFSQVLRKCSQFRALSWLTIISDRWVILLKKA